MSSNSINHVLLISFIWFTPPPSFSFPDPDVQGAICRTGVCTFYDMLHVFDGSTLHELRLVFGNMLEAAWVCLAVEQRVLRTCHNRGRSAARCDWLTTACSFNMTYKGNLIVLNGLTALDDNTFFSAVFPNNGTCWCWDRSDTVWLGVSVSSATRHHQRQNPHHHSWFRDPVYGPAWKEQ